MVRILWKHVIAVQLDALPMSTGSCKVARFGSTLLSSSWGNLLVGGVGRVPHRPGNEIMVLGDTGAVELLPESALEPLRPFLGVGCSVSTVDSGGILITGGGAVCFSFGSSFNPHWLLVERADQGPSSWRCDIIDESNWSQPALAPISAAECVPESQLCRTCHLHRTRFENTIRSQKYRHGLLYLPLGYQLSRGQDRARHDHIDPQGHERIPPILNQELRLPNRALLPVPGAPGAE